MQALVQISLVAFGSALGGLSRWGVGLVFDRCVGTWLPWGTFFINVSGSLFLGWFATILSERLPADGLSWISRDNLRLLVAVGFTGTYTTFSTFELEGYKQLADQENIKAFFYLFGSLFVGLAAVWLGVKLAKMG